MRTRQEPTGSLQDLELPIQAKLAGLWTSFMFLYVYVDILGFYQPGVVEDILAGRVWQLEITQTWALGALALMAVPILMIFLSLTLPARANRTANLIVAPLYLVISVANAAGESWLYYYTLAVGLEVVLLALVVRYAWAWPRTVPAGSTEQVEEGREKKTAEARDDLLAAEAKAGKAS